MDQATSVNLLPGRTLRIFVPDSRSDAFAGLVMLGLANGSMARVCRTIIDDGLWLAVAETFGISVIVWLAFAAVPALLLRLPPAPMDRSDRVIGGIVLLLELIPASPASWIGLSLLALHMLRCSLTRRVGWLLLAMAGAMFWGYWLLTLIGRPLLALDAGLVGWLFGGKRSGNTIGLTGGGDFLWIAPGCSSLTNVSLAILCWALVANYRELPSSWAGLCRCLSACAAVVAINVGRIGLMLLYPGSFELIHGAPGATAANWASLIVIALFCLTGLRDAPRVAA